MSTSGNSRHRRGFTLIEVIVVLVIAGFLGALLVNLMGTSLLKGSAPATTARESALAESAVENVVSFFVSQVNTDPPADGIAAVKTQFGSNSSFTLTDMTLDTVPALRVTATVGGSSATTLLTQERTSTGDSKASY